MYDFMKPSMFCHYAHCTSNKAGFHKAAARSHLDRLLRTDWMCRAEWVAPVKCLEPENASTRIRCLFIFISFWRSLRDLHFSWRQTRCIGQVSRLLRLRTHADARENLFKERKTSAAATFWAKNTLDCRDPEAGILADALLQGQLD